MIFGDQELNILSNWALLFLTSVFNFKDFPPDQYPLYLVIGTMPKRSPQPQKSKTMFSENIALSLSIIPIQFAKL